MLWQDQRELEHKGLMYSKLKKRIWLICFTQNIYRPYPTVFVNFSLSSQALLKVFDIKKYQRKGCGQGVTKTCRLSWLTNSALVNEPKCGG